MIVREVMEDESIVDDNKFDYFNDTQDTLNLLRYIYTNPEESEDRKQKAKRIYGKIEAGNKKFMENFFKR